MNEYSVHTDSLGSKSDNSGNKSDAESIFVKYFCYDNLPSYEHYFITSSLNLHEPTFSKVDQNSAHGCIL